MNQRIRLLQQKMEEQGVQWYLCTTADPHGSEYINAFYEERRWLSGFTGSNGDLLIGPDRALLWTDGRYFVQAEKELQGSGIELMRMGNEGVPELLSYIRDQVYEGEVLMADGRLLSAGLGRRLRKVLKDIGAFFLVGQNLVTELWKDRPRDSAGKLRDIAPLAGVSFEEKLSLIRQEMNKLGAGAHILSKLDDQMWLYDLRGNDIAYNPVAYAYTVLDEEQVELYVKKEAQDDFLTKWSSEKGIVLKDYRDFYKELQFRKFHKPVLVDTENCNYLTLRLLEKNENTIVDEPDPTEILKAVKNETEIRHIKEVYLRDSACLFKFLHYMKEQAGKDGLSEVDAAKKLDGMRSELEGFRDLSFTTISAFGPNGAMMHYEATEEDHAGISANGVYLVDSGAQYDGGTTDVTRTLLLGENPEEVKRNFTRVAIGMLALQNAVFLKGCTGRNLDILARMPMWQEAMDYKCGTGHGIGYMLNVHEGPQGIRPKHRGARPEAELQPGMLLSDEPGVYLAGKYGIRLENILLVKKECENSDGIFYSFEPLTYVPIDRDGICPSQMQPRELEWLNAYHEAVYEKLYPFMVGEEREWLREATSPIKQAL